MTEIAILAVTRLSSGVCVAGVTQDRRWVRPTRPNINDTWRQLEFNDCKDRNGKWIVQKGNVVSIDIIKPIPDGAHSEDWLVGNQKPTFLEELSEQNYRKLCQSLTEDSIGTLERQESERSLMLIHPDTIISFSFGTETNWERKKKYIPRCTFKINNQMYTNLGITDAEWRKYGRQFMQDDSDISASEVFKELKVEDCWFVIGRNIVNSNVYLLVVGIHFFPVKHFDMDFSRF